MFKKFNFVSTSEPMDALQTLIHDFSLEVSLTRT